MNEPNEQAALLADAVSRLFGDNADAALRAEREGWQQSLWTQVVELGLTQTLVPERLGGFGGHWHEAYIVLRASGYHAVPLPLGEAMLAGKLLAAAGLEIPTSSSSVCFAPAGNLVKTAAGLVFRGSLPRVPWGRDVEHIITVAVLDDAPHVVVLWRRDATALEQGHNLAGEPRDHLSFDTPALIAPCPAPEAQALADFGALLRTAQIAGALRAVLERSIDYARTRVQFGKPIAQFQAIQQQLAVMGEEAAAVECAARNACRATAKSDAAFEIACAKLRANMAIGAVSATAHQVHGAIGFTREYSLRWWTQRLWSWRSEFGNDRHWAQRLGDAVITRGAQHYWPDLTARDDATARADEHRS